jgi:hypothetical protein
MLERFYILVGVAFIVTGLVEYLIGYALHSTIFSSFTGGHTIVYRKKDPKQFKEAISYHFIIGVFFVIVDLLFGGTLWG